jgi:hypothetical protein
VIDEAVGTTDVRASTDTRRAADDTAQARYAWRVLSVTSLGVLPSLAQHRHPTNRPHLTLATAGNFPPGAVAAITEALQNLPIRVRMEGLHFFGGRAGVLAWAVDGGDALLDLQAQIWSARQGPTATRSTSRAPGPRTSAWPGGCQWTRQPRRPK